MRLTRIRPSRPSRGLSIVELLVGVAIGLFVVAGATMVVSTQLSDNRALLLETQVQQDLRAAADLISRDIRRAGYWGNAHQRVWPVAAALMPANPYPAPAVAAGNGGRNELMFGITHWEPGMNPADEVENDALDDNERFGFALNAGTGVIEMRIGDAGWQAMTDASVVNITQFNFQVITQAIDLPCQKPCPVGVANCPPQQLVRDVVVVITGQARHDATVQRSVRSNTRLRNDEVTGACPA